MEFIGGSVDVAKCLPLVIVALSSSLVTGLIR